MDLRKDLNGAKYMFPGNESGAKEKLHICIYNYMKTRGFHKVAKLFAEEANIEIAAMDQDESLLTDWWGAFWSQFCSNSIKQPGGYPESSAQPSAKEALEIPGPVKRTRVGIFQTLLTGNSPQHVNNVVGQPPEGWFQTPPEDSQRRAGKRPVNTGTTSILGHSASRKKGKRPLRFLPVQLPPTEMTPVLHHANSSHLHIPGTIQPPPQVVGAFWPVKLEPTYPTGWNWGYLPAATFASEDYWENQGSLAGVRVRAPDVRVRVRAPDAPDVVRAPDAPDVRVRVRAPDAPDVRVRVRAPDAPDVRVRVRAPDVRVRVRAPDGPDPDSCMTRVPAAFLEFMRQTAEALERHSNTPRAKF